MKVNDAIAGALFIGVAALIFVFTSQFRDMPGQNYGAGFFPRSIAVVMALLGASLVFKGVRERGDKPWAEALEWMRSPRHVANFALVLVALVFYILVSDILGYVITGFITLYGLLLWLRGGRNWLSSAVIAVVAVIVIQQFFGQFLRVPLPWGILEPWSW
ncbi:tripartite tricarboxylate transporter TctB family protein [Hwanghaeella sp.]|uniref:tripartite tricarboxylate transporter TctB family protein n=1 Tax=Hwanghaeella sp. TaxID=2605943 RepID=UPI003CCC27DF